MGPGGVSDPTQHRSQTQITVERRLYDIGSILCSIGLIARIYVKKRWVAGRPGIGICDGGMCTVKVAAEAVRLQQL